jgi:uridine phosphorylase
MSVGFRSMGIPRYPNFSGKHVGDAVISPTDAVARYLADAELARPDAVVLTYQRGIADELRARRVDKSQGYPAPWRSLWFIEAEERRVAVACDFGFGAPVATMVLEELIALGAREFISIGTAGCLRPEYDFGRIVVCSGAIRDEGVSHHYAATEKFAWPSNDLTARLARALHCAGRPVETGLAWTIDTPFRETVDEARSYQAEGVICVEMEAAALFTVAKLRRVEIAAAFVMSDHLLADEGWSHAFGSQVVRDGLVHLLGVSLETLGGRLPERATEGGLPDVAGSPGESPTT